MEQFANDTLYQDIHRAQSGDEKVKEKLVEKNLKLVYHIASRFYERGYEKEDLHQIGTIGLLKAIEKFNTGYGVCFSTYAVPMILGEIRRFLRDDGPIKVSRSLKRTANDVLRFSEQIQKTEGRTPGVLEIASNLGIRAEDVVEAKEVYLPPESFFSERSQEGGTFLDTLPDKKDENDLLNRLDLKIAVTNLPKRERTIVIMRYFLEKSQSEVAKKLGISQVQVSRLEKKILKNLKMRLMEAES